MKILVTGAAGFLGRYFLEYLMLQNQHDIWYMDKVQHPDGISMDVEDMESWLNDFDEDVDLAIHMAGPVGGRMTIENDPLFNADALRLDSVFFRWAVKHATKVIYPSSSAVYPVAEQQLERWGALYEGMFDPAEDRWGRPDEMYGFTKMAGEVLAMKARQYGLETLVIRPFSGYGPGQSLDYPIPSIALRALRREDPLVVWGNGEQKRDPVYVTDLVKRTMAIAGLPLSETVNIGNSRAWSFAEIARLCAEIVGYQPTILFDDSKPKGVDIRVADIKLQDRLVVEGGGSLTDTVGLADGLANVIQALKYEQTTYVVKK